MLLLNGSVDCTLMSVGLWMSPPLERTTISVSSLMTKPVTSGSFPAPKNLTSLPGLPNLTPSLPIIMAPTQRFCALTKEENMSMKLLSHTVLIRVLTWNSPFHTLHNKMGLLNVLIEGFLTRVEHC